MDVLNAGESVSFGAMREQIKQFFEKGKVIDNR